MNRAQFLSLFAIPFLPKVDLSKNDKPVVAIEYNKIQDIGSKYGLTPKQVLDIYFETGVLIYQSK